MYLHQSYVVITIVAIVIGSTQATLCRIDWPTRTFKCLITDNDTIILQYQLDEDSTNAGDESEFHLQIQKASNATGKKTIKCEPRINEDSRGGNEDIRGKNEDSRRGNEGSRGGNEASRTNEGDRGNKNRHVNINCHTFEYRRHSYGDEHMLYYHLTLTETFVNNSSGEKQTRTVKEDFHYQPTWYSNNCCKNYYKLLGLEAEMDYSKITLQWKQRWFHMKSVTVKYWDTDRTINVTVDQTLYCSSGYCRTTVERLVLCKKYHVCIAFLGHLKESERCLEVKTRCPETGPSQQSGDDEKGHFKIDMAISLIALGIVLLGGCLIVAVVKIKRKPPKMKRTKDNEEDQIIPRGHQEDVLSLDEIDPSFVTYEYPKTLSFTSSSDENENVVSNDRNALFKL